LVKTYRQKLGKWGEELAVEYLIERGYSILGQNVRTPYGEIDVIAQQQEQPCGESPHQAVVVFVEVKTRSSTVYGFPEDAVTREKRAHMLAAAQGYLQIHPELSDRWRIDVIAIQRSGSKSAPEITHFENALA
jgi:putative endonuclease